MNPTLLGLRLIKITLEPLAPDQPLRELELNVRQIPIREYDSGLKHFSDEIALVAFMVGKPREFALELTPDSYEAILKIGREVNERGFFAFCRRRIEVIQTEQIQMSAALAQMPEDVRQLILNEGAKAMASTGSPGSSSPPPRPRA